MDNFDFDIAFDIAIIGGGASGMCAAISAARKFLKAGCNFYRIAIFEALPRLGKKILATGNGRCNLTNKNMHEDFYFENGPFAMKVMSKANNFYVLDFFKSLGLLTTEDDSGRIYPCSNQAASVLDVLRFSVQKYSIKVIYDTKVENIRHEKNAYRINGKYSAKKLILATGGKSSSKLGSDGSGYQILRSFGIKIIPPFPALTGLLLDKSYPPSLKGLRHRCRVSISKAKNQILAEDIGEVQFNQKGVSGIPIMQISRFASKNIKFGDIYLQIDRMPNLSFNKLRAFIQNNINLYPFLEAENILTGIIPKALAITSLKESGINPSLTCKDIKEYQIKELTKTLKSHYYKIEDSLGFSYSQVSAGGVCTSEFNENSLELKRQNGFFCCGEIINVDGMCGGYNLQWAWSSGIISGTFAAESLMINDKN